MSKPVVIELIDGYFIEADDINHTLKQRYKGTDKEGNEKEYERFVGYFSNLEDCIERATRLIAQGKCDKAVISMKEYAELAEKAFREVRAYAVQIGGVGE